MTKHKYRYFCFFLSTILLLGFLSAPASAAAKKTKKPSARIKKEAASAITYGSSSLKDGNWLQLDSKEAKNLVISLTHTPDLASVSYKSSESRVLDLNGTFAKTEKETSVTLPLKASDSGKTDLIISFYSVNITEESHKDAKPVSVVTLHATTGSIQADYTAVDAALSKIPEDLSLYTEESVAELEKAKAAVKRDLTVNEQSVVDGYAEAITKATENLSYKPADYSKVDAAIAKAKALDPKDYENFSQVTAALTLVDRNLDITQQDKVDAMALAIEHAIASLEKKDAPAPTFTTGQKGVRDNYRLSDFTKSNTKSHTKISKTTSNAVSKNMNKKTSPKTGDTTLVFPMILLFAGLTSIGSFYYYRKFS